MTDDIIPADETVPTFLRHPGSAVALQIVGRDWSASPLGPIEAWPTSLRTTIATMLACPTAMYLAWGPDLVSFYNDAYVPILGYRAEFALGMPFRKLWSSIWTDIEPLVHEALSGGQPKVSDMRLDLARAGEAEESYWSFSYSPAFDDEGGIAGMFCVTAETTSRVLAERERDAADERLDLALSAGDAIGTWDWDVANDLVRADARFAALYGVDPAFAAAGAPIADFFAGIHPDDIERVRAEIDDTLHRTKQFHSQYRLLRADGEVRWVVAQGLCVDDENGVCVRFPGASYDVTERVLSAQRLQESEARATADAKRVGLALAAGAIVGTWFWDLRNDTFTVDDAFVRASNLDPALGREGLSLEQVASTVHRDDRAGLTAAIGAAISRGGPYAHQYRVDHANGRARWLEANGRVDFDAKGRPSSFSGVLIDLEDRRRVEAERDDALTALRTLNEQLEQRVADRTAELMRAEDALRQSQKMEAVGQLTGGLAHDFNNLLTGISGALEMMQVRITQGRVGELEKYSVAAQGAVRRAAALTHRLLAFSRRQTLDPKPTDVNRLVYDIEDLIRRTVGPQVEVETVGKAGLWSTLVDQNQLENALLNLCINARDAMPDGGRITIETANKWLDARAGQERDLEPGQYVSVCVTDTGTGMSEDVVAHAFDPFFTTKPMGEGTGLGLSMIYGFARQSGGQVRIYTELGTGTTMCIYLPRHTATESGADMSIVDREVTLAVDGETNAGCILVVDDEPTVRMLVVEIAEELGYEVLEAFDGPSAMRALHAKPGVDLLITDVGLPGGMNGRQVADAALTLRPDLRIIFITGYAENAVIGNGQLAPNMMLVTKPFAMEVLAERIRSVMN